MRAIQISEFGGPEVLELVDLAAPSAGPDQVLIRVNRAGVNFADTHSRSNSYLVAAELPYVPGGEVVGVRADTGETRWIARRGEHRNDGDGGGGRFIGVIYDITEGKNAEAAWDWWCSGSRICPSKPSSLARSSPIHSFSLSHSGMASRKLRKPAGA